jgi:predicted kinase
MLDAEKIKKILSWLKLFVMKGNSGTGQDTFKEPSVLKKPKIVQKDIKLFLIKPKQKMIVYNALMEKYWVLQLLIILANV